MKREFQIGDRVVCVAPDKALDTTYHFIGRVGTIIDKAGSHRGYDLYQVEYDEGFFDMQHNCGGRLSNYRGWNHYAHEIELFNKTAIEVNDLL